MYLFTSERLGFRNWKEADKAGFAEMNANPEVFRFFPSILTKEQSDASVEKFITSLAHNGFTFYAVDYLPEKKFIGFIGLSICNYLPEFDEIIEIGWRLNNAYWNKGLATEGAKRCLEYAAEVLELKEIYSFTAVHNKPSERVMQKIGMKKIGEFDHPKIEKGYWLERHVLYKIEL